MHGVLFASLAALGWPFATPAQPRLPPTVSVAAARTLPASDPILPHPTLEPPVVAEPMLQSAPFMPTEPDFESVPDWKHPSALLPAWIRGAEPEAWHRISAPQSEPPVEREPEFPEPALAQPTNVAAAWIEDPRVNPPPRYPAIALRRGWEGVVELEVSLSAAGVPICVRVLRSSGRQVLDDAARQAVENWKQEAFRPAVRNGEPVADTVSVRIRFRLS